MNKNVLYYTINIPSPTKVEYYSMLYYSLQTLKKHYNGDYDVVVFYKAPCFKDFTFAQYCHLEKYKIVEDFPFVKFIESDYPDSDLWMTKWWHFAKLFEMGYEKVFYLDCDVIFFDDISYFFDRYDDDSVWTIFGMACEITTPLIGKGGMASGQMMISKKIFDKIPDLYKEVIKERKKLISKAKRLQKSGTYTPHMVETATFFSEQYAGQMAFEKNNIPMGSFDLSEICFGGPHTGIYNVSVRRNQVFIETSRVIIHYLNNFAYAVLPENLHTPSMTMQYRREPLFAEKLVVPRYSTMV